MLCIGDIHGDTVSYAKLLKRYKGEPSVQIGDYGFGWELPPIERPDNAYFIRGNHDNPELARQDPHYLGDYGVKMIDGYKVFFLSGAFSVDWRGRKEGVSWWRNEELSLRELDQAIDLYQREKPDIVLSHDCPDIAVMALVARYMAVMHKDPYPSRTGQALTAMWDIFKPKQWIFGHWHLRLREEIAGTEFRCLPPLGWCQIHGDFAKEGKAA